MLNKIILFVVNQYSVIMQRNCPWLLVTSLHRVQQVLCREAERNRPRPRIQRLPTTHLKLIERACSIQGNTVLLLLLWLVVSKSHKAFKRSSLACSVALRALVINTLLHLATSLYRSRYGTSSYSSEVSHKLEESQAKHPY